MATERTDAATVALAGLAAMLLVAGATIGFVDLFLDTTWVRPVAAAIAGGVGGVVVLRLLGVPAVPRLLLVLAGGVAALLAWFPLAQGVAWGARPGVLVDGLSLARREIAQQVAPTPFLTGLSLVVVAGTLLVAIVVAELLVRRLVLSALMAAMVLWVAPLTIALEGRSLALTALAFVVPAAVALGLLEDPSVPASGTGWPRRARGTAGAMAVALLAVPLAVASPGHDEAPVFDLTGWGNTIEGYEPIVDVGDQLRLPETRRVLEVETNQPAYLRTAALEVFDGRRWRVGSDLESEGIPRSAYEDPSDGIRGGGDRGDESLTTYAVDVLDLPNVYLPVPNRPLQVATTGGNASLTWSNVGEFVATDSMGALTDSTGADYVAQVALPQPTYDELRDQGQIDFPASRNTSLPTPEPALAELARQVVEDAGAETTIDQVLAVQDHLAGPDSAFTYSTDVPELRGDDALQTFVFETQTGYCEYFSTAMAVMLRTLDIPARVATGYLPGEVLAVPGPEGPGRYAVASTDAHAWVEVSFPGSAWVTFDPTPRSDTAGLRPQAGDLTPFGPNRGGQFPADDPQGFAGFDPLDVEPSDPGGQQDAAAAVPAGRGGTGGLAVGWWLLLALVLVGLAVAAWLVWRQRHVPEDDDPTTAGLLAVSHLLVGASALGCGRHRSETLAEVATRWRDDGAIDADHASTLATLGGKAAFAGTLTEDESARLRETCARIGDHLRDRATTTDRVLSAPRRLRATP